MKLDRARSPETTYFRYYEANLWLTTAPSYPISHKRRSRYSKSELLNAILFLYRQVLQQELDSRINAIRAKRPQQIPIVLSPDEAFVIDLLRKYQAIAR